jgi:hypothetical protein
MWGFTVVSRRGFARIHDIAVGAHATLPWVQETASTAAVAA